MRIFISSMLLVFISACSQPILQKEVSYLTVLHTNDNHGRFWHNKHGEYGMAARKTLIDQLRGEAKAKGHSLLLLSGGDINTGVPESDLQFAEPDFKGMSEIGYDAMAIGNHEFDNSLEILDTQQSWANFPFLSANIFDKLTNKPRYQPYTIIKKNNLTIAVIGFTTTDTAKIANPKHVGSLAFKKPEAIAASLLSEIQQKHQPDITIAVTHMGHYVDANHGVNAAGDITLARSLPKGALDIVVGGHSQEPVCMAEKNTVDVTFSPGKPCRPDHQNGTWIMQAHEWGKYVGKAEFKLEDGQLTLLNYALLPVNLYKLGSDGERLKQLANEYIEPNQALKALLLPYQQRGEKQVLGNVGYTNGKLEGDRNKVRLQQVNLASLIISAQMTAVEADFGIISGGGIRDSIQAGDISYKDVLKVHPFNNLISYIDLSGQQIVDYFSVIAKFPPDSGAYLQYKNISFNWQDGEIAHVKIKGQPIELNKTYRMSINAYNASGGDGYPTLTDHQAYVATNKTDAEVLKHYIEVNTPINIADYAVDNLETNAN
ncbi:bifunctional UDP-sugar hydrolase/5'-nucleotidase UshA [Cognaticolwellia aestuarii]|uniref:bifunctional UDP-sugar hydrolase/5'-nucleotidase UshA n=1 Tax=Cognaticolwellia aestuarii TaxID=329993 RepID=UPI00098607BC|nr:bifunctional UDP-sugar hydrolase/5'-nucleotidase UshA [Cognaticolwellia aestuarii]